MSQIHVYTWFFFFNFFYLHFYLFIYFFFNLFIYIFYFILFFIVIIIINVCVFSTCTGLVEKRIRFPQGLSPVCTHILELFIFVLLACELLKNKKTKEKKKTRRFFVTKNFSKIW